MEDVISDSPPPSRFFPEDLDNFASPKPPLPPPFLLFSDQNPKLRPSLLVLAVSPASCALVHRLRHKTPVGALFLPDLPLAGNSLEPSPRDSGCSIYAASGNTFLVSFQYPAAAERARSVAKKLVGEISPERVLVLDSVRSGGFRGRLSADEALAFKLETSEQSAAAGGSTPALRSVPYFPTGSVADGLGAAVLAECQMRKLKGTLCLTWPEAGGPSVAALLGSVLRDFLPGLGPPSDNGVRVSIVDSDLYV